MWYIKESISVFSKQECDQAVNQLSNVVGLSEQRYKSRCEMVVWRVMFGRGREAHHAIDDELRTVEKIGFGRLQEKVNDRLPAGCAHCGCVRRQNPDGKIQSSNDICGPSYATAWNFARTRLPFGLHVDYLALVKRACACPTCFFRLDMGPDHATCGATHAIGVTVVVTPALMTLTPFARTLWIARASRIRG